MQPLFKHVPLPAATVRLILFGAVVTATLINFIFIARRFKRSVIYISRFEVGSAAAEFRCQVNLRSNPQVLTTANIEQNRHMKTTRQCHSGDLCDALGS